MYPAEDLSRLAQRKIGTQRRLELHRRQYREATLQLAQPLALLDRALIQWRRISPLLKIAAVPVGFLFRRKLFPRLSTVGALLRWLPTVFGAVRSAGALRFR